MKRRRLGGGGALVLIASTLVVGHDARAGSPDLVVRSVNRSAMQVNPATLVVSGTVAVEIENLGAFNVYNQFYTIVFIDLNNNRRAETSDLTLGTVWHTTGLNSKSRATLIIPVSGTLPSASSQTCWRRKRLYQ